MSTRLFLFLTEFYIKDQHFSHSYMKPKYQNKRSVQADLRSSPSQRFKYVWPCVDSRGLVACVAINFFLKVQKKELKNPRH